MVASLVLVVLIVAIGIGLTTLMSPRLRFEERLAIGAVAGSLAVSMTSLAAFTAIGMGRPALVIGLAVPGMASGYGLAVHGNALADGARSTWQRLRLPVANTRSLRPFVFVMSAATAVTTRVLAISYQSTPEGISAGNLAVWGDWSAHLMYAGSFANGDNRGFDLPIASGHGFRYHFLSDFFGALFSVTGATLPQALAISEWLLAVALPPLIWFAVLRLTRSRSTACLTLLLFTLSGGVGLWYFMQDLDRDGWSILTSLPRTYSRIPDVHLWVDNTISASLYAQRSTLMGLSAGFAALIVLLVSRPNGARRGFVAAGLLIGVLGIAHAHTLLTALALGIFALLADRKRVWWWFLIPAALVGLPVSLAILPETSSIRWLVGWMAPGAGQAWPWFWFRNVGLLLPLFATLSLFGGIPSRIRRLTAPLWLWFVVPNFIAFHPWEWNNTKYFLYWQLAGSLAVAAWISGILSSATYSATWRRWSLQSAAALVALLMMSAGALDMVRAMQRSAAIPWVSTDDVAVAEWLRTHSDPDDVIVYGMTNTSAAASLGGRRAVSGFEGWTFDLGLNDWHERWQAGHTILTGDPGAGELVDRYGADFILIGPDERQRVGASDEFWERHGTLVFSVGEHRVYAVDPTD